MITIYGADWCEDTQRSLRHLRRLAVAHEYINIDEDADALERAKALNGGMRRTPTIDLGIGGPALVEPDNDTLSAAPRRDPDADAGGSARAARRPERRRHRTCDANAAWAALVLVAGSAPRACAGRCAGRDAVAATGLTGWCPVYQLLGVSSFNGPAIVLKKRSVRRGSPRPATRESDRIPAPGRRWHQTRKQACDAAGTGRRPSSPTTTSTCSAKAITPASTTSSARTR